MNRIENARWWAARKRMCMAIGIDYATFKEHIILMRLTEAEAIRRGIRNNRRRSMREQKKFIDFNARYAGWWMTGPTTHGLHPSKNTRKTRNRLRG